MKMLANKSIASIEQCAACYKLERLNSPCPPPALKAQEFLALFGYSMKIFGKMKFGETFTVQLSCSSFAGWGRAFEASVTHNWYFFFELH